MLSAVLAFVGAVVYGAADFLGGLAAKRLRSIVVTAVAAASGLAVLGAALPFVGGTWTASDVAWGALSGAIGVVAIALLYACLAIGPMSILSPLTAVVSAIAPMLWGLLVDGETLSPVGYAGLGVAIVAVVLVGFIPGEKMVRPSTRGLLMAVGAGLAIGAFLIVIDQTSDQSGVVPLILNRGTNLLITVTVVAVLAIRAVVKGRPAASVVNAAGLRVGATPTGHADLEHAVHGDPQSVRLATTRTRAWWLAIACGVVDAAANALLLLALRAGELSIVSALTALYPAGTIVLAAIVLRERVAWLQWAGLALALVAGGMLALA
ncbi:MULTISPECIES: EamA family transporter [unclassified Microbacterium]|uniref:EamA family transporter n=1 Tax=unclassified Microbacterium TaxID=2609290 RepID=UPI00214AD785|nr:MULTISPECIES: EamA family transporter [unclassified Microbacterium]MCR2810761.1 EamA family transporter [Microbacterium sp. zg.B185]WIM18295.1 EamA family transporter [Microbacterium sp. zg-B185]